MKNRCPILWIIIIFFLSIPVCSQARTGYVSDMLLLTFRQGPGTSFSVLQTLKSNTPLTILEEENEYYKVELDTGHIGWVDKQFVVFEPPKTQIIEQLTQEKSSLQAQLETLSKDLEQLKTQLAAQESDKDEKETPVESGLKETVAVNQDETGHRFRTAMIKWFLAGVGVLLLGWIIGQSISSKKRKSGSLLG
jgi:SH3 domain protein